ncbi:zinc knuckle CX2CX4HX4C containing protein [Tanacetum coccineum]
MSYNGKGPSFAINRPLTRDELSREELENDLYERILILNKPSPVIETLKYSDQHKKMLDSVLLDKLKLDGELKVKEEVVGEAFIKSYKAIKEKNNPGVFVLPINLEGKHDFHALVDTGSNINVMPYRIYEKLGREQAIAEMLEIKVYKMGGQEEIFTSEAWRNAFDINEPIYTELCHDFYSTYEFDEEVTNEELITKKLIKFRLGGRAHSLTLLEFACRLGLYHAAQIREEGLRCIFKEWLKREGVESHRKSMICCGQFITRMAKKISLLVDEVLDGLSVLIYCRPLDATTLSELIDSNKRLIAEDLALGVLRVAMTRPLRPTMQDLYDIMGNMEIRQGMLERMSHRWQSYHSYSTGYSGAMAQAIAPKSVATSAKVLWHQNCYGTTFRSEHPRCCQSKGSKVEESLVHLMMMVKFEVLIEKKKMCSFGLMRFDWLIEFLMAHLEELEMKKL